MEPCLVDRCMLSAALSDSSSVGMGDISCLCGLVLEEEHGGGSKFRAGLRVSARLAFLWQRGTRSTVTYVRTCS